MAKVNSTLTGAAGEHYVAYILSKMGFLAALVREGSPTVDILASNVTGTETIAIQVKSTDWAMRTRGRAKDKVPYELQFPLGYKAVEESSPKMFFAFVDLKGKTVNDAPDVYLIPAIDIHDEYEGINIRQYNYFRLHWKVEKMEQYKNNWQPLIDCLSATYE